MSDFDYQVEIKDVLAATDIVQVIGRDIALKKSGESYKAKCPFHDDSTPSFFVDPVKQKFHCFGCGEHGDVIDWLVKFHRMSPRLAIEGLAGNAGIQLTPMAKEKHKKRVAKELTNALEEEMLLELQILIMAIGPRVSYRQIPDTVKRNYPHIVEPDQNPLQREYLAAKRLIKALEILYSGADYE